MSFECISVEGHSVYVPSSRAEDKNVDEAVWALVEVGSYAYNRALTCLENKQVESALEAASSAIRTAPYCAQFVEFACVLAIRHGDFQFARSLLDWAHTTGMDEAWPDYSASLQSAVNRWNRFVQDIDALRKHYQSPECEASYRELLLLAAHLKDSNGDPSTDVEIEHLDAYSIQVDTGTFLSSTSSSAGIDDLDQNTRAAARRSDKSWLTIGLVGVAGLLLGALFLWVIRPATPLQPDSSTGISTSAPEATPPNPSLKSQYSAIASAQFQLTEGNPLHAYQTLDSISLDEDRDTLGTIHRRLRSSAKEQMYEDGVAAWRRGDMSRAVSLLTPIAETNVGRPQERLYALGMSAAETGQEDVAIRALESLQDYLTPAYSHYAAQSAYTLIRLLPDERDGPYVRLIKERFPDTIYNNSVLRARE